MENININTMSQFKDFIEFKNPVVFDGFEAIGMFPYERAQLDNKECVAIPRRVFDDIELNLNMAGHMDNKIVVVFKDTTNFNTGDFAIQFKDCFAKMGKLEQIVGYGGRELILKPLDNKYAMQA